MPQPRGPFWVLPRAWHQDTDTLAGKESEQGTGVRRGGTGPTRPGGAESRRAEQCERAGGQRPQVPHAPFLPECSSFSPPTTVILLILLCFEGLLFLIFTSVMFGTQVHSICTDETVSGRPAHQVQPWARGLGGAGGGGARWVWSACRPDPGAQCPGPRCAGCAHMRTHTHTHRSLLGAGTAGCTRNGTQQPWEGCSLPKDLPSSLDGSVLHTALCQALCWARGHPSHPTALGLQRG